MTTHRAQPTPLIGRVGALAVALGVGFALTTGQGLGVAHADETGSADTTGSPTDSTDTTDPTAPEPAPAAVVSSAAESGNDDPEASVPFSSPPPEMQVSVSGGAQLVDPTGGDEEIEESEQPEEEVDAPPLPQPDPADALDVTPDESKSTRLQPDSPPDAEPVDTPETAPADGPVLTAAVVDAPEAPAARFAALTVEPLAAAAPTAALIPVPPTPAAPLPALVATVVRVVADVVNAFAQWLSPPPGSPAPTPPTLWAVLAWVRREIQVAFFNSPPEVTTTSLNVVWTRSDPADVLTENVDGLGIDADGDPVTYTVPDRGQPGGPTNGTVTIDATTGELTYDPDDTLRPGDTDSFTITVSDAAGPAHVHGLLGLFFSPDAGHSRTVTLNITIGNSGPVAEDDTATTNEDESVAINVLANDSDDDGAPLTVVDYTQPTKGSVALLPNGAFIYNPDDNANGTDTFTYTVSDGTTDSAPATVTVTIAPVPDAPLGDPDFYTTDEDTPLVVSVADGVLDNDHDVDGDAMWAQLNTQPTKGSVTLNADGSFTYTPNADENGTDTFTYVARSDDGASAPITVTVTINPVADGPEANPDTYVTDEDTRLVVSAADGVLKNDTGAGEARALRPSLATAPTKGVIVMHADGSFTYTPNDDATGVDTFTYTVSDGVTTSAPTTVTITINAVNDAPAITGGPDYNLTTDQNGIVTGDLDASDPDGDPLTYTYDDTGAWGGKLVVDDDGLMTYTPDVDSQIDILLFSGPRSETFTITAADPTGASVSAPVTFTVAAYAGPEVDQLEDLYDQDQALIREIRQFRNEERELIQALALLELSGGDPTALQQLLANLRAEHQANLDEEDRVAAELEALREQIRASREL